METDVIAKPLLLSRPLSDCLLSRSFAGGLYSEAGGGSAIQSLTNAQKLSLPANTPVGTPVRVTDGFVVSGATNPAANGFYFYVGMWDGKKRYANYDWWVSEGNDGWNVLWESGSSRWFLEDWNGNDDGYLSDDDVEEPWQVTTWQVRLNSGPSLPVLTHPAVLRLAAPSTAQGGVFVSGGTLDGIFTKRDSYNGKDRWNLLGSTTGESQSVAWNGSGQANRWAIFNADEGDPLYYSTSDVATPDLAGTDKAMLQVSGADAVANGMDGAMQVSGLNEGRKVYSNVSGWEVVWIGGQWVWDNGGDGFIYSNSDVLTPDLATGWKFVADDSPADIVVVNVAWRNASDDSPASITVTSVSVGELNAGFDLTNDPAGDSGTYLVNGILAGRQTSGMLVPTSGDNIAWTGTGWGNGNGSFNTDNTPFFWQAADGHNDHDGYSVSRNGVASEANWEVVP